MCIRDSTDCGGVRNRLPGKVPTFIHFASVDVEENERSLFSTWPWDRVKVAVFVVETGAGQPGLRCHAECHAVRKMLADRGYVNGEARS